MRIKHYYPTVGGHGFFVDLGHFGVGAVSDEAAPALHAAAGLAKDFVAAVEKHPELAKFLPPQAQAALLAIKVAAWAAKNDKLKEMAKQIGPNAVATVTRLLKGL